MNGNRLPVRVARWSATHPWRAIAAWLVLVAACVACGSLMSTKAIDQTKTQPGESGRAARLDQKMGGPDTDTENVLISARTGPARPVAQQQAAAAVSAAFKRVPGVLAVAPPVTSQHNGAVLVQVTVRHDADADKLLAATASVQRSYPELRVEEAGGLTMNKEVNDQVADDLGSAADLSLPVTLVILLIAFGAILAAGVPVLLAMSAVGAATGLSALVSHVIPSASTVSSMILMMGMAVGVDYSLFYVKRARTERARGSSTLDSVEIAAQTAGHSVLVSGAAVIVSMLGLFLTRDATFSSLAIGSILVVAVAVLGSLTVLPAVLVKLGKAIDRPRVPVLWRIADQQRESRVWSRLVDAVQRRPARALTLSVLALLALAAPALGMKVISDSPQSLPNTIAAKHTLGRITAAFPGKASTDDVLVQAAPSQSALVQQRLTELAARLEADPLFVPGTAHVTASADGSIHKLAIDTPYDSESGKAHDGVRTLRAQLDGDALAGVHDATWAVGGDAASNMDYDGKLGASLPWVVGFVVLATMLIMGVMFRSWVIAFITAGVNLLSAGAAFGVLVLTFQNSWAESLLDFHSTGAVINWIPLFTFAVLFGLSMDYHVFVLTNIREAVDAGQSRRDAVRTGIVRSAGTVTCAALVMVSVFSIFALMHLVEMKQIGVSLAAAILIDAVIVRMIVLPAVLTLTGQPRRRHRRPVLVSRVERQLASVD